MSLLITVGGLVVLSTGALIIEAQRDTDLADPTTGVTSEFRDSVGDAAPIRFADVAERVGIVMRHGPGARGRTLPEDTGSGAAWGDYDADGDWDLYVVSFPGPLNASAPEPGSNRLFRNEGGQFEDVTDEAGVGDLEGFGMGASFADYDGDGDVDLYVTNHGPNRLFQNRGDGTFEDVAVEAGVADVAWSTGAAWGDFDRDGALDLYVCNYVDYDHDMGSGELEMGSLSVPFALNPNAFDPVPNRLYRNLGNGFFEDVAVAVEVDNRGGRSLAATMCDLDGDGWLDIYVNNDVSANRLFRNLAGEIDGEALGAGLFQDDSLYTGTGDPRGSMGLSVAEVGGMDGEPDGLPDLFITHWVTQENALYESLRMPRDIIEYRDKTRRYRLGEVSIDNVGWGCGFVDFDLDGRVDIAVTNGSTLESKQDRLLLRAEPLFLFWNAGTHFIEVAGDAGPACGGRYWGRGLAAADYDQDGDVDLAIVVNRGQPLLLENQTATEHASLAVLLHGPAAALFGARVEVVAGGRRQVRWYGADVSFLSMHAPELIFGLGEALTADEISVRWADDSQTRVESVPAGRFQIDHGH